MNGCCLDVICVEHPSQQTLKSSPFVLRFDQKAQHKQLVHVFITSDPRNENKWIPVTEMILENNMLVPHFAKLDSSKNSSSENLLFIKPSQIMDSKNRTKREFLKQHLLQRRGVDAKQALLSSVQSNYSNSKSNSQSSSDNESKEDKEEDEDNFAVTPLSPQSAMFVRDLVKEDWTLQSNTSSTASTPVTPKRKEQHDLMRLKRASHRLKSTDLTREMQIRDDKLLKINRLMTNPSNDSIPPTPSSSTSQLGWKDRWLESIEKEMVYSYDDLTPSKEDCQLLYGILKELSRKAEKMYIIFSTRLSNQNSTLTSFWTKNTNANLFEKKQVTIGSFLLIFFFLHFFHHCFV